MKIRLTILRSILKMLYVVALLSKAKTCAFVVVAEAGPITTEEKRGRSIGPGTVSALDI